MGMKQAVVMVSSSTAMSSVTPHSASSKSSRKRPSTSLPDSSLEGVSRPRWDVPCSTFVLKGSAVDRDYFILPKVAPLDSNHVRNAVSGYLQS